MISALLPASPAIARSSAGLNASGGGKATTSM
jgi:hypothetical protein